MARSKSSKRWLTEHFDDPYVKQARKMGLRSRSAFKLLELNEKYGLIKPGEYVVDLGSAPGGWCQVAGSLVGQSGKVIAMDILPMEPLPGVQFIQGDFTRDEALSSLQNALDGKRVNLVLSDMAPNMSGVEATDQARSMYLAELALEFAQANLQPGGDFLVKIFQGEGSDAYVRQVRGSFASMVVRKPDASRPRSREVYLLARGLRVK